MTTSDPDYRDHGAALLPGLCAPEIAAALAYQISLQVRAAGGALLHKGALANKPCYETGGNRWPFLVTFLWGLTPRIQELVGADVLPSYSYFRTYQHGDVCRVHSDRPACQHSLSLTLAYADDRPWALSVAEEEIDHSVPANLELGDDFAGRPYRDFPMGPGDAVLYRGVSHRHGRLQPNPNRWSAHLFMHWVDRNGPYRDSAFDGQSYAGRTEFLFPA